MNRNRIRERREEAIERQSKRDNRTEKEQLEVLDNRLGINIGAEKERARLLNIIHAEGKA